MMTSITIRGVSLFTKVVGKGYPIVFMHGGPGVDHSTLLPLLPCSDSFTLVFYDHRCNGRSEGVDVSSMTWENLTADADSLRQALGFDQWAVLGHSFGGMVALEYALRYSDSLSHLVLIDTCGDAHWVQCKAPEILAKRSYSPAAVKAAQRFFNGQITPREIIPSMLKFGRAYYYKLGPLSLLREARMALRIKRRPEAVIFGFSQLLKGWTVMGRLREIRVPTLVLGGRSDFQFPPEHQAILADRIPQAQLEIIECAGHNAPIERSAEIIEKIKNFIRDN